MNYLLILDLAGTLIETVHITNRLNDNGKGKKLESNERAFFEEYYSRINNIGRKLNAFLENNNNRIVILSSIDHATCENLEMVIKDINDTINEGNIERIDYYIADVEEDYQILSTMDNGNKIIGVCKKDIVYDDLLSIYQGYYPIAVDDRPSVKNYLKVLERGGQCFFIKNELYSFSTTPKSMELFKKRYHLDDNIDRLIKYFLRSSIIFSYEYENYEKMPEFYKFDVEEIYIKLNNGDLNIEELYNWLRLTDMKHFFFKAGYSINDIDKLIKYHCIGQFPSFEMAYQKILLPKIKK